MMQTSKPLTLSIVIPAFNEAGYLEACLESIRQQIVMPDEVIVVDNNSSDDTALIARSYPFVRVMRAKNQGIVHARNTGFDAATGDIIGRIDADTQLSPTWTLEMLDLFTQSPDADALTGRCYFYDAPFPLLSVKVHEGVYYRLQAKLAGTEILWGSNMAIRRETWQAVQKKCSVALDVPEDIDLSLVLQENNYAIVRSSAPEAAVSLRRGRTSPLAIMKYLRWWPRVYRAHLRPAQAAAISVVYACVCAVSIFTWPLASLYKLPKRLTTQMKKYALEA